MGWNYEVDSVREVRVWTKEEMEEMFQKEIESSGVKNAMLGMIKRFIELAEQVRDIKREKRVEQCDVAFGLMSSSLYAILNAISKDIGTKIRIEELDILGENDGSERSVGKICNRIENRVKTMLEIEKTPIDERFYDSILEELDITKKERNKMKQEMLNRDRKMQKKKIEYLNTLLNVKNGKSLFKIYFEQIDILVKVYCKETKKSEEGMRRHIFSTVKDLYSVLEKEGSIFQSIALSINSAKYDRINGPFSYFLDVNC